LGLRRRRFSFLLEKSRKGICKGLNNTNRDISARDGCETPVCMHLFVLLLLFVWFFLFFRPLSGMRIVCARQSHAIWFPTKMELFGDVRALADAFAIGIFEGSKSGVCVCGVSKNRDTQHAYVFSQREEAKNVCVCRVNPLLLFDIDSLTPSLSFSWFFIFISAPFHPSLHSLCLSVFRVYIACKRRENVRLQTRSETGTLWRKIHCTAHTHCPPPPAGKANSF
jgi:hypothetical protein